MLRDPLIFFILASLIRGLAYGQATPTPSGTTAPQAGATQQVTVGPNDPVITINGFCADPLVEGNVCKTVVRRAQFEKLIEALQPDMPLPLRLKVANTYARNVRMAVVAEARGLDKTAAFEEEMRFGRMQLLAQDLDRALRADANDISDDDLAAYYKKHISSFEEATAARIFVPHAKQIPQASDRQTKGVPLSEGPKKVADVMASVAADLRARAVRGEDPDKLQIEAYAQAGIVRTRADTKIEKVRRATLPPQHESVMDLKPGEVSNVLSDPDGAHFIYKILSKETLTLENAKEDIRTTIFTQRYHDSLRAFQGNVVFNDAYFNPTGKSNSPPQRNGRERTDDLPASHE